MATEPDLDLKWKRTSGVGPLIFGLVCTGGAVWGFINTAGKVDITIVVILILLAFGVGLIHVGIQRLTDDRPKLSLKSDGLRDHRTNTFVRWTDFRGVRLYVKSTNSTQTAATMYVRVAQGGGLHEIAFDVFDLDLYHDEIVNLVHKRGLYHLPSPS